MWTNKPTIRGISVLLRVGERIGKPSGSVATPDLQHGLPKGTGHTLKVQKNHFPNFPVKHLRLDNAKEFRSHAFEDFCTASVIDFSDSVAYEHSQNGLAEAYVKKIQLVARPLLLHANLPSSFWGHAVLHAAALLKMRPTLLNVQTPIELLTG